MAERTGTAPWQPIATAPREPFELDIAISDPRLPYHRMRMGPVIKIRGTHEGETEEFCAVWTVLNEQDGYWFSETEPVDWPVTEWRPLTSAEEAECQE
jgi:hypothetical protein